jgi:hypothetical protein
VLLISILNTLKDLIIPSPISLLVNFCSPTMAPKKDKHKNISTNDSKAQVLKPESNVAASASPISSLDLANWFSPFSSKYPILYSSTLISPYDPFVNASKKSKVPSTNFKKPFAYMVLPFSQHLLSIKMNRSSAESAEELATPYFPPGFHWIPKHPLKNLAYYSNILLQTKFVHIKPIFCQSTMPKKIIYHNVYINTPIFEKDWGDHPSSCRNLKGFNILFCYYDYIDARSKFFLSQFAIMDHSWFISFDHDNSGGILPLWFVKWWSHFGLLPEVLFN